MNAAKEKSINDLSACWLILRKHIQAALPLLMGSHTEQDLLLGVAAGNFQLWPGESSFQITYVDTYETQKRVTIMLAGGDAAECESGRGDIEAWAKRIGAKYLCCSVRPAIDKNYGAKAKKDGWKRVSVNYVKEI